MRSILNVEEMRHVEQEADANGITYDLMMQRAGQAAALRIITHLQSLEEPRVVFLIGKGNNGGDGLVAANELQSDLSIRVGLYLLDRRDEDPLMKPLVESENGVFIAYFEDDHDGRVLKNMIASADVIVDAIFGIGIRLPIKGDVAKLLRTANQAINTRRDEVHHQSLLSYTSPWEITPPHSPVVIAIDCPSGLDCDTGEIDSLAIPADETITFIAPKHGLLRDPGLSSVGNLYLATLDIEDDFDLMGNADWQLVDSNSVARLLPDRSLNSNKGTFGKTLIVAGSLNYMGAAALSAIAAYRSGTGLVTVGSPGPVVMALAGNYKEPTWLVLPHDMGVISEAAVDLLLKEMDSYSALLIGPGMTQEDAAKNMLLRLLNTVSESPSKSPRRSIGFLSDEAQLNEASDKSHLPPLVLDADALNILSKQEKWWELLPQGSVITPHPGEMARLCGEETKYVVENRWELATEKAKAWNITILLKGAHTIIASPDGRSVALPFKTDALATAGTGDVLAGLLVGFRAQRLEAFESAICAGYVHGLSGELAAKHSGNTRSVIAGDVLNQIGAAFKWIK